MDFEGTDLLSLPLDDMRDRRGRDLAMIFQDPLSSLNPVVPIGIQVTEVLERHRGMKRSAAMVEARELLDSVGIPDPIRRLKEYPHQLSGGMRQRALIAMALACRPRLMIADEPTTALDVTIQAQILALLKTLVVEHGTALIMITHDLGVVAGLVDQVNVLYGGRVVERADRHELFASPRHPYTHGLLESIPRLDAPAGGAADADPRVRVGQHPVGRRLCVRAALLPGDRGLPGGEPGAGTAVSRGPITCCAATTRWCRWARARQPARAGCRGGAVVTGPAAWESDPIRPETRTCSPPRRPRRTGAGRRAGRCVRPSVRTDPGCAGRRVVRGHRRRRRAAGGQRPQGALPDQARAC